MLLNVVLLITYLITIPGVVKMMEISVTSEVREHRADNRTCGFLDTRDGWLNEQPLEFINTEDSNKDIKRQNEELGNRIHYPWNSNDKSRYVELVIVVDTRIFIQFGRNANSIHNMCIEIAKTMNSIYAPLNIYIALVGVVIWRDFDKIQLDRDADITLQRFLHYRKQSLSKLIPNDNAQLLTGFHFNSGIVGKALKGPICTSEFSGGVNVWDTNDLSKLAATLAHELGHNLGMDHDGDLCECPEQKCLMSAAALNFKSTFWSSCSFQYLAVAFNQGMDYCLRNLPQALFGGPVCGNGFVEPGEECDCGVAGDCSNPCCSADTCRLSDTAECGAGDCCDYSTCRYRHTAALCRASVGECDLPEYCDGHTQHCPHDVHKSVGSVCSAGGHCYGGSCVSHTAQCRLLWGSSAIQSPAQCYTLNTRGDTQGNCGYRGGGREVLTGCHTQDVMCGMLHCSHLSNKLQFGLKNAAKQSHTLIRSGKTVLPCRNALVDLGLDQADPGLVPSGASCGEGRMCLHQKCVSIASVQLPCPGNCSGQGVCNNIGNCHCDKGWGGETCDKAGAGGSKDSGPATHSELPVTGYSYIVWLTVAVVILAVVVTIIRQVCRARLVTREEDYRVLIEKYETDQWQARSTHQLTIPRAFQL